MVDTPGVVRGVLVLILVSSAAVLAGGYFLSSSTDAATVAGTQQGPDAPEKVAPARESVTVITTDSNVWYADEGDGPRAHSEIVAFNPNGSVLYYNDSHERYWDVDPSPAGDRVVMYSASDHLNASACYAETVCTRNVVERVDLETGEVTRLYSQVTPGKHSTRWHDVDRLGPSRLVVADIHLDRVFIVNTTTEIIEWEWTAQSEFSPSSGGPYPSDWTHLNDVEVLPDGRIMVSLRNQDQVVFIDPDRGMDSNWTLGRDDAHQILFEQHNPDYLPAEDGGPAVLVADSENNRVVEYQRVNETWNRTWTWRDADLQWPRDADRLPNGHTLVTDSNGNRVFEVNRTGEIVWAVDIAFPYEAERLGTGDESSGGPSASAANLTGHEAATGDESSTEETESAGVGFGDSPVSFLDGRLFNSVSYLLPMWMDIPAAIALVTLVGGGLTWIGVELYWSRWRVSLRWPFRMTRE